MKRLLSLIISGIFATSALSFGQTDTGLQRVFSDLNEVMVSISNPETPKGSYLENPNINRVVLGNERITNDYSFLINNK